MSTFRVPMSGVFIENRYRARSLLVIHLLFVPVNCKQNPIDKSFAGVKLDFDFAKKNMVDIGVAFSKLIVFSITSLSVKKKCNNT